MEKIVIDSHALFWFLTENQKLSKKAKQAIEDADQVIVPSIVLMEVLFILEKYNVAHQFLDVLQELQSKRYIVFGLQFRSDADQVIVPSIVLMEVLFILEKYNVAHQFLDVLQELQSKRYIVFGLQF